MEDGKVECICKDPSFLINVQIVNEPLRDYTGAMIGDKVEKLSSGASYEHCLTIESENGPLLFFEALN